MWGGVPMPAYPYPAMAMTPMLNPVEPASVDEGIVEERRGALVQVAHNVTYNLNPILANTITGADYFLSLLSEYPTFEQVVDVIKTECVHVEAFEPGKAHLPSYAFCCMYRMFMLKLDTYQMNFMLRHKSPYVRAIGLLYLRCIGEQSQLMEWTQTYLEDETEFKPGSDPNSRPRSIASWWLDTVRDSKYGGTLIPRCPVPVVRAFERKALEIEIKKERAEKLRKYITVNMKCRCKWSDGIVYDAVVLQILDNGRFYVCYTEYGNEEEISITDFEPQSVLNMKDMNKERSGSAGRKDRDHSRSRSRERQRSGSRDRKSRRSRERRKRSRSGSRGRSRGRSRDRKKSRRSRSASGGPMLSLEEEIEQRMAKLRDNEKSSATSSDGRYCAQIVSYKKSLSKQFKGGQTFDNTNKKLDLPDAHPRPAGGGRSRRRSRSPSPTYVREKKELTHEQKMKQSELLARYGDLKGKT